MRPSEIADVIAVRGGIVRSSVVTAHGASRRDLQRAVDGELIARVRLGVYALASADPLEVVAAAHGGELACASALR